MYTDDSHFHPVYNDTITLARDVKDKKDVALREYIRKTRGTGRPVTLSAHAVDVWGCGVLLYEMLFARTAFLLPDEPTSNYESRASDVGVFRAGESAVWRLVQDADGGIARTAADVHREGLRPKLPYDVKLPSAEVMALLRGTHALSLFLSYHSFFLSFFLLCVCGQGWLCG